MITAFTSGFLLDFLWVAYAKHAVSGDALKASAVSAAIGALSLLGMSRAIGDPYQIAPWILGLFFGSYIAVRYLK